MEGIGGLTTFGDDAGGDDGGQGGVGGTATSAAAGTQQTGQEQREPHSRTRAHDGQGRFAGPAPTPPAPKPDKDPAPPPAAPARLKIRVPKDDGSGEDEIDLTPEEAGQRMAEARKLVAARDQERQGREKAEKEGQAFRRLTEGLKDGKNRAQLMRNFVRESGLSAEEAEEFFAEALHGELTDSALTPEQRRLRELEEREQQRVEEERTQKATAEFKKFSDASRSKEAEYSKLWGEALKKTGLPATPALLADIAKHHLLNKKKGYSLTADELASHASAEFDRGLGHRLKDVPAEEFAKRFPDVAKAWTSRTEDMDAEAFLKAHPKMQGKLLKHFREKARARPAPGVGVSRPPARAPAPKASEDSPPVYYDRWTHERA